MKRKLLTFVMIGLLMFGVQLSFVVDSFPGFHGQGDCNLCHNNPATSYNPEYLDETITLDGLANEPYWDGDFTHFRRMYVPVGGPYGSAHTFVKVTFAQNSTHLYILASWDDPTINGTDTEMYDDADGISFMFNINDTDFSTGYGMVATRDAQEAVDVFTWKPAAAETGTQEFLNGYTPVATDGTVYDQSRYETSWEDDLSQDWHAAAVHGNVSNHNEQNYQVEFVRKLTTDDPMDVQFNETAYYDYGIALYNSTSGKDHYVSPVHSVMVFNPDDTDNADKVDVFVYTVPETITEEVTATEEVEVTVTQQETEGKSPVSILPVMLALFAIPVVVMIRRKN